MIALSVGVFALNIDLFIFFCLRALWNALEVYTVPWSECRVDSTDGW